jgi:hypothetical protein
MRDDCRSDTFVTDKFIAYVVAKYGRPSIARAAGSMRLSEPMTAVRFHSIGFVAFDAAENKSCDKNENVFASQRFP